MTLQAIVVSSCVHKLAVVTVSWMKEMPVCVTCDAQLLQLSISLIHPSTSYFLGPTTRPIGMWAALTFMRCRPIAHKDTFSTANDRSIIV